MVKFYCNFISSLNRETLDLFQWYFEILSVKMFCWYYNFISKKCLKYVFELSVAFETWLVFRGELELNVIWRDMKLFFFLEFAAACGTKIHFERDETKRQKVLNTIISLFSFCSSSTQIQIGLSWNHAATLFNFSRAVFCKQSRIRKSFSGVVLFVGDHLNKREHLHASDCTERLTYSINISLLCLWLMLVDFLRMSDCCRTRREVPLSLLRLQQVIGAALSGSKL